jgi:hypothetical protein
MNKNGLENPELWKSIKWCSYTQLESQKEKTEEKVEEVSFLYILAYIFQYWRHQATDPVFLENTVQDDLPAKKIRVKLLKTKHKKSWKAATETCRNT